MSILPGGFEGVVEIVLFSMVSATVPGEALCAQLFRAAPTELGSLGWTDQGFRDSIPLAYEVTNQGYGWYLFHHHHMHISMGFILFADGFESGHTGAWSSFHHIVAPPFGSHTHPSAHAQ